MSGVEQGGGTSRQESQGTSPKAGEGVPHGRDGLPRGPDGVPRGPDGVPRGPDQVSRRVDAVPVEARAFQGQRAGVVTRTVANTIDFLLVVGILALGYGAWCAAKFLINPTKFSFPTPSFLVLLICAGIVLFYYFTVSWATTGRTYGDHQMGLRVVNPRGERLRWPGAVIRAAFCVLLPIGLYWAVLSPTNRSLQDSVLRTSVLYDWAKRKPRAPRSLAQDESAGPRTGPA